MKPTSTISLCLFGLADPTDNLGDFTEIMVETQHIGGPAPRTDDRLFWLSSNDVVLNSAQGDGVSWVVPCRACDHGDIGAAAYNGIQNYEFKIEYIDVWGTNFPSGPRVARVRHRGLG